MRAVTPATAPLYFPMRSLLRAALCAILMGLTAGHCEKPKPSNTALCIACIRGDMSFLASDELQGRGSGTRDEHLAALYAASLFAGFGLEPGGDRGSFLQRAPLPSPLPPSIAGRLQGFAHVPRTETWNVVGILRGSDPEAGKDAILLSAHLDHLGIGPAKNGDRIYNGADDDASGTTAVIELARVFAGAPSPRAHPALRSLWLGRNRRLRESLFPRSSPGAPGADRCQPGI